MRKNNIAINNENWLKRDYEQVKRKKHKSAREFKNLCQGKGPELHLHNDEITWKRPSKYG